MGNFDNGKNKLARKLERPGNDQVMVLQAKMQSTEFRQASDH